jgi:hypothetical protein
MPIMIRKDESVKFYDRTILGVGDALGRLRVPVKRDARPLINDDPPCPLHSAYDVLEFRQVWDKPEIWVEV